MRRRSHNDERGRAPPSVCTCYESGCVTSSDLVSRVLSSSLGVPFRREVSVEECPNRAVFALLGIRVRHTDCGATGLAYTRRPRSKSVSVCHVGSVCVLYPQPPIVRRRVVASESSQGGWNDGRGRDELNCLVSFGGRRRKEKKRRAEDGFSGKEKDGGPLATRRHRRRKRRRGSFATTNANHEPPTHKHSESALKDVSPRPGPMVFSWSPSPRVPPAAEISP